ncbi:MAG: carbohydrate ABC transporter permease, partial [Gaiellaceae bacterium]
MSTVATPVPTGKRRRRGGTKLKRRQTRLAWLLLLPSLAVVALVAMYPLGKTIYQSFTDQEFLALLPTQWVGLQNYQDLWHDTQFRDSIWVTIKFTLITVTFEFALGLAIALVVNSKFKGRGIMRAVMLVPWAIPTVVAAQMWKWMLDDTFGVINDLLVR